MKKHHVWCNWSATIEDSPRYPVESCRCARLWENYPYNPERPMKEEGEALMAKHFPNNILRPGT